MVKGKEKGNAFENRILRDLRKIFEYTHKTIGSGNAEDDKGDITFEKYMIECKHRKKVIEADIQIWWCKLRREAKKHNKYPVLVYKENYKPIMVMTYLHNEIRLRVIMYYLEWRDYVGREFKGTKEKEERAE